jgi:hypothetical protein
VMMMFVVAFGLGSVVLTNHTVLRALNRGVLGDQKAAAPRYCFLSRTSSRGAE